MKWIKYEYVCGTNIDGSDILLEKKVGYSDANIAIAEVEAYNGEYTIVEDDKDYDNIELPDIFGSNITYGTEDLVAGESPLAEGEVYLVYE